MSEQPGPSGNAEGVPDSAAHDVLGLDLARQIAMGVGAREQRRTSRRSASGTVRRTTQPQRSGARADERDPKKLGATIEDLVAHRGWRMRVDLHQLLARWPALVGVVNADHSRPEAFDGGVLTVRTDSTTWASSLRSMAPQVVAKLNAELGDGAVSRIAVRGPDVPSWKHGPRSVPGRGVRDTYG